MILCGRRGIRCIWSCSGIAFRTGRAVQGDVAEVLDLDFVWQAWYSVHLEMLWNRFPQWQGCSQGDVAEVLDLDFVWQAWYLVHLQVLWNRFPQWQGCSH